jgi:hypothetical protein
VKDTNNYAEALLKVLRDGSLRRKLIENGLKNRKGLLLGKGSGKG